MADPSRASRRGRRRALLVGTVAIGVGILVALFALADGRILLQTLRRIPPLLLLAPLAFGLLSYAAMARSYQGIAVAAGVELSFGTWLRLTFVSNTANYLVTSAGLSGFAVRIFLLGKQGVPSSQAVLISLVQTFITNTTLLAFILAGFVNLVMRGALGTVGLASSIAVIVVFVVLLAWGALLAVNRRARRRALLGLAARLHRLGQRIAPRHAPRRGRLWRFQRTLNDGVDFLLQRKRRMLAPAAWILCDWVLTLAIIWSAFKSTACPVAPGVVVAGFGVGSLLSLVSLVPGGLGVMEGSMTGVFVSMGVPYEPAVVATLIFRAAYYVVPLLIAVFFFHGLMREATIRLEAEAEADGWV